MNNSWILLSAYDAKTLAEQFQSNLWWLYGKLMHAWGKSNAWYVLITSLRCQYHLARNFESFLLNEPTLNINYTKLTWNLKHYRILTRPSRHTWFWEQGNIKFPKLLAIYYRNVSRDIYVHKLYRLLNHKYAPRHSNWQCTIFLINLTYKLGPLLFTQIILINYVLKLEIKF